MNWKPIMRLLCHQREDRTYKVCNEYLVVCSRCLGIYAGFLFSVIILFLIYGFSAKSASLLYPFLLILPMGVDGVTQAAALRQSKNWLRFITGYLAGAGTAYLLYFVISILFAKGAQPATSGLELLPMLVPLPVFLFALEKSQGSDKILLKKFFNFVSIFTAAILLVSIVAIYSVILIRFFARVL